MFFFSIQIIIPVFPGFRENISTSKNLGGGKPDCIFLVRDLLNEVNKLQPMKASGRFLKNALECMTQCVLLPGVELHFEEVLRFYAKNIETIISKHKKV